MGRCIVVHGRVMERHPEISPDDVAHAWVSRVASATRRTGHADQTVVVGFDARGRLLEMVAVELEDGTPLVFHCMTPPSAKTLKEIGLANGR